MGREAWDNLRRADKLDNTLLLKMAARANMAIELAELELSDIKQFYGDTGGSEQEGDTG